MYARSARRSRYPVRRQRFSRSASSSQGAASRSIVAFLLIACFGILFVGCGGTTDTSRDPEEFTFTEDDVARVRELVMGESRGGSTGSTSTGTVAMGEASSKAVRLQETAPLSGSSAQIPVLNAEFGSTYRAIRSGPGATGDHVYRVTNEFLNVRSSPQVNAEQLARLTRGETVAVVDFQDAAWAKVKLPDAREGYVSTRYIAKVIPEEKLAQEKTAFQGLYFVNFGFLNVRKDPNAQSEKIGELPGQALVRPLSMDAVWARVPFEGKEGYVAVQYLKPFLPNFLVRQETFVLPILHYRFTQPEVEQMLPKHIARLQQEGVKIITLREYRDLLLRQEERDVRLDPRTVVLAFSDLTPENIDSVSDILRVSNVNATLFLHSQDLGLSGITDKMIVTLVANGEDIQSGGHTGDDLRSLTNAQMELELKQSRMLLEQKTGKPVFAVAYPLGGVNERVESMAADAGYLMGVGATPERVFSREQMLRLPSYLISPTMTEDDVARIAKGQ